MSSEDGRVSALGLWYHVAVEPLMLQVLVRPDRVAASLTDSLRKDRLIAASLIVFPNLATACRASSLLRDTPAEVVDVLPRIVLEHAKSMPGMPVDVDLLGSEATGLLIETTGADPTDLEAHVGDIASLLWETPTINGVRFSHDPQDCARLHAIHAQGERAIEWLVV